MFQNELSVQSSGVKRLSQQVGNYESILYNIPEEQRPHLHCGGSLKSHYEYPLSYEYILTLLNNTNYTWTGLLLIPYQVEYSYF
jgi:hypothetical protein